MPGLFEAFRAGYPLGRWGTSDDIAAAAVFLASDECFMTGENLQVNGGLTLRAGGILLHDPHPFSNRLSHPRGGAC